MWYLPSSYVSTSWKNINTDLCSAGWTQECSARQGWWKLALKNRAGYQQHRRGNLTSWALKFQILPKTWFSYCSEPVAVFVCLFLFLFFKKKTCYLLWPSPSPGLSSLALCDLLGLICLCLSGDFLLLRRDHDHSNSYKGKDLTGAGLQVWRLSCYPGRRHYSVQTDMELER